MEQEKILEKIDIPGQSDIFEALSNITFDNNTESLIAIGESTHLKKQISFLMNDEAEKKYTGKIEAPIYYPRCQQPHIMKLCDITKTKQLIREINDSKISDEEKDFLVAAAWRHAIFHYERIADYYAHASQPMRKLMEKSALVIVDFNSAIENGFVSVCNEIREQYFQEYRPISSGEDGDSVL